MIKELHVYGYAQTNKKYIRLYLKKCIKNCILKHL